MIKLIISIILAKIIIAVIIIIHRPPDWSAKMNKLESFTDKILRTEAVKLISNGIIDHSRG